MDLKDSCYTLLEKCSFSELFGLYFPVFGLNAEIY